MADPSGVRTGPLVIGERVVLTGAGLPQEQDIHRIRLRFSGTVARPGAADPRSASGHEGHAVLQQHPGSFGHHPALRPRCSMACAVIRSTSDTARTIVPMALISNV